MAKIKTNGLDYFPFETDFLSDLSARKLVKLKGRAQALGIFINIICYIFRKGYYLMYDKDTAFIVADDLGEEVETVDNIVNSCVEVGLFDKTIFDTDNVLTSKWIQSKYNLVQTLRKHKFTIDKYKLIENGEEDTQTSENFRKLTEISECSSENSGKSIQNKKKEKKEKKTKVNPHSLTHSLAHTCACEGEEGKTNFENFIEKLRNDQTWLKEYRKHHSLKASEVKPLIDEFVSFVVVNHNTEKFESYDDLQDNFNRWTKTAKDKLRQKEEEIAKEKEKQLSEPMIYPDDDNLFHQFVNFYRKTYPQIAHMSLTEEDFEEMHKKYDKEWVTWALKTIANSPIFSKRTMLLKTMDEVKASGVSDDPSRKDSNINSNIHNGITKQQTTPANLDRRRTVTIDAKATRESFAW